MVDRSVNLALRNKIEHRLARVSVEFPEEENSEKVEGSARVRHLQQKKALLLPGVQEALREAWCQQQLLHVECNVQSHKWRCRGLFNSCFATQNNIKQY